MPRIFGNALRSGDTTYFGPAPQTAATPTFSPAQGTYSVAQTVAISNTTPGSTFYYTTNGSTPTTGSTLYTGPITVSATQTVQAIATASGYLTSAVGGASYTISASPTNVYKFTPGRYVGSEADEQTTPFSQVQSEINTYAATPAGFLGYQYTIDWHTLEDFTQTTNLNNPSAILTQYPGCASVQQALYYLQAKKPGALLIVYVNFEITSLGNYTNPVVTTTDWTSSQSTFNSVPAWVCGCTGISGTPTPGTLTVPDYYGASTTSLYSGTIAPIYSGSSYYGFAFQGWNGNSTSGTPPGAFDELVPAFWNPAVNQARIQALQAFSQYQFTAGSAWSSTTAYTVGTPVTSGGNNWICAVNNTNSLPSSSNSNWVANTCVGLTIDTCNLIERWGTNDEYSYSMTASVNITGGQTMNPPYAAGDSSIAPTSANAEAQQKRMLAAACTAAPHMVFDICVAYGFDGTAPFDSNSTMPAYWNNNISGTGMSAIVGASLGNSNWQALTYSSAANTATANPYQQSHIGISPASGPGQFTLPTPTFTSLVGISPVMVQHQLEDYWQFTGTTTSTAAAVTALLAPATKIHATHEIWNITTSDASSPYEYSDTFYTDIVQPTLNGVAMASTLLPTSLMAAPENLVAVAQSTTQVLLTWTAQSTGTGTGLTYTVFRNGSSYATGIAINSPTYTDMAAVANTSYTYTIAVANSNGTGPQNAGFSVTTPIVYVTDFPASASAPPGFSSSSSQAGTYTWPGGALAIINSAGAHQGTGAWWATQVNVQAFTTTFTAQWTGGAANGGFAFVVQNSTTTTNPNIDGATPSGNTYQGDANVYGYGGYASLGPPQQPCLNSIGVIFGNYLIENGSTSQVEAIPVQMGLYVNGGPDPQAGAVWPYQDPTAAGINFVNGHTYAGQIVYDGTILTVTMLDTVNNNQIRLSWPINIPACTQQNTAYVGFTAGSLNTGPMNIYTWSYTAAIAPRLATPTFSVAAGEYGSAQTITISAPAGASIYYSTNGLAPTTSSTLYSAPITVSANTYLQAVAVQTGHTDSYVASANYLIQASGPTINFPGGFASSAGLIIPTGWTVLNGSAYQLTSNTTGNYTVGAIWYAAPVTITSFSTTVVMNFSGSQANGIALVIQNQNQDASSGYVPAGPGSGPSAGYGTGQLAVTGGPLMIASSQAGFGVGASQSANTNSYGNGWIGLYSSVALVFNNAANGVGVYLDGAYPEGSYTTLTGVNLGSGNNIQAQVSYSGTTLSLTLKDLTTLATFSHSWTVNIASTVGANSAYVGLSASTNGGQLTNQFIESWTGF